MSTTSSPSTGSISSQITSSFTNLAQLITAGSYLAGLGFSAAAIMKFKQHKDNPTQIPVDTGAAFDSVSAATLFLPLILEASAVGIVTGIEYYQSATVSSGAVSVSTLEAAAESASSSGDVSASTLEAAAKAAGVSASTGERAAEKALASEAVWVAAMAGDSLSGTETAAVESAVSSGDVSASSVEAAAEKAGITSSDAAAAEAAAKAKLS